MSNFHPTYQQLIQYVAGEASPQLALMVAAHVDMCPLCQMKVACEEEALAEQQIDQAQVQAESADSQMQRMLSDIIQQPQSEGIALPHQKHRSKALELDGREFEVPRCLQRYAEKVTGWNRMVGKLWQARVDLGGEGRADFIFMEKGGSVPEHTHNGQEMTLVLDGEFVDEYGHYQDGDFLLMDGQRRHSPRAEVDEGCLVFSIVDKPLHFTSGLSRLLNPFSHLFFK
ncbi:Anti-sigma-E factor ChrR [Saliniradius amylolyticus]|uniref:Anti-sigma-E factor ChrR n=1 Tax=Saliniradius amylolyticus TaxID=2183582 RepID=A0A2S2E549_9ALTE|nr:ChrR family anti-sigma-E factor [Saliniradius amylolyticus]AWL12652.1 Anti-sigma-E factor ChrR [Saliniradius amylolyticus]